MTLYSFPKRNYLFYILFLFGWGFALSSSPGEPSEFRVLLVGDSWTEFMWVNRSLRGVFSDQGHPNIHEKGDATTVSGSTAAEWTDASMLETIRDEINAHPSIDIVQITLGGNDFLEGMAGNGWFVGISLAEEEALFQRILGDVQTVIDFVLNLNPNIEVLLSFYDYANFEESLSGILGFSCNGIYNDLNSPTTLQINQAFEALNMRLGQLVDSSPRVSLVDHTGLMQFTFGFPDRNIPPQTIERPGDLNLPGPINTMFLGADCIHLSSDGYRVVAENLWQEYYQYQFCVSQVTISEAFSNWFQNQTIVDLVELVNRQCF